MGLYPFYKSSNENDKEKMKLKKTLFHKGQNMKKN